ncbi:MAG: ABC transporter ATP-binding protein [Pirellulaceae bacterium]|jgi:peptide/nickel transport system ATP-binding protein|nr:ABC transporter ATP-binding protein [Pirellulaceae bacterium]MDP7020620.1 ABC transporter ATP-binding protein [Pirellulaceae bacterium]
MNAPLLDIQDLRTYFHTEAGVVRAVDNVSMSLNKGQTLGVVGESGSGKSVTSLSVMRLLVDSAQIESGSISFMGRDVVKLPEPEMRDIRGKEISMIFQEPMTSLNPVFTVGWQVAEAIRQHEDVDRKSAWKRTLELFREVGIPDAESRIQSYPHQMSGGQKQRVMIAMALSCNPKLLIADEPTTALDVTIQAQILDIIRELRDNRGMSILFITHDLAVIAEIADHVAVMFQGKLVEYGKVIEIFSNPQHPYTKGLLACRPRLDSPFKRLPTIEDFMDIENVDGEIRVIEKDFNEERARAFIEAGRPRLLHPAEELKDLGYDEPPDADLVAADEPPLLEVDNLVVHFPIRRGVLMRTVGHVHAVDDISFKVYRGQTLGLVGESGCGKTTTGRAILQLVKPTAGVVRFDGEVIDATSIRQLRRRMQIIFQDPYSSLNPRMTVESMLIEPMMIHRIGESRPDRRDRAVSLLDEVGLGSEYLRRYPHEFSGGQRQRLCIARSLTVEPDFLVCDESVSALDVSVQAQVLNLLNDLQARRGLTYIFISHDLSVVKFMSDMMAVMNEGKFVEFGPSESIYAQPREEYTCRLIEATPNDDLDNIRRRQQEREAAIAATDPDS